MTSPPAASTPSSDVCRVTVVGPTGTSDVAIPIATPISTLLPILVRHVTEDIADRGGPWVLQRLGEEPLSADGTPASLELRHGDILYLRAAEDSLPALHFDDIADGVAHAVDAMSGGWRPELTRRLSLVTSVMALMALAAALIGMGPGPLTAVSAGAIAAVLAAGCVMADQLGADKGTVLVAGLASMAFALLAGLVGPENPVGGYALGASGVLTAAVCAMVTAVSFLALRPLPLVAPATVLLTALASAVAVELTRITSWSDNQAVSVVTVSLFVLGHFGPRFTLRMARLRVPQLPRNAEELQEDIEPEPQERVDVRVKLASAYLDTLSLASAAIYTVGFWYMTRSEGWIGWLLPLLFASAVLLRSRSLIRFAQRTPMVVAGAMGLIAVVLTRFAAAGEGPRAVVIVVLLVAAIALLITAWRLPNGRLLPVWGHTGDIMETFTAIALLPLLFQALHAYSYFRSLAS
ncbi:type VII secretion integral membrane protein EccD [Streptomyces sp. NPDC094468]|uniref:type VII secretion integral membrane protein EccD n=1 Tax=Streptomyces sp. NPDC094468 TaxID=3366066 RepID=UPI00380654CA